MPRGTRSITESVKAVGDLRAALVKVMTDIAKEKAEATKKAKATPPT